MLVTVVVTSLMLLGGSPALAGLVGITTTTLGAGHAPVTTCGDLTTAALAYDIVAGAITGVTVDGLPSSCNGSTVALTLTFDGAAVATADPVAVTAGSASFTSLTANPSPTSVADARIVLVG